jgi:short-subunit dehydrogenase
VTLPPPTETSTALITGASSGIGAAIARELASRGHGVTLVARREERLRELADEVSREHGVRAEVLAADLADEGSRDEVERRISELGLTVEILVNNAGFGSSSVFAEADRQRLLEMVRVNVEALIDLQARHLPAMVDRGRGTVINIASTAAFQPMPGSAAYAATKAFVLSLSEAVHSELAGTGVTLTAVCPGPVRTEFAQEAGIGQAEDTLPGLFWMSAEDLARAAVDAAAKGKRAVVPGALNRAGSVVGQHSPRSLALPLVQRIYRRAT